MSEKFDKQYLRIAQIRSENSYAKRLKVGAIIPNKKTHLCQAYRCSKKKAPKKRFCHKHHARFQKETNPIGYTYNILHQNAKRRGKEFKLTLEEFKTFCEETNYIELKGKKKKSSSIDRIDPRKGYEVGNIQVLSLQANSSKGCDIPDDDLPS